VSTPSDCVTRPVFGVSPSDDAWFEPGPPGSTPLGPDEMEGLIPSWIATRGDLDTAEQANILDALTRRKWQRQTLEQLLDDLTARQLHKAMFGQVWKWAGAYRLRELNLGVDPHRVSMCVRDLMADTQAWIAGGHWSPDEVAYRFHHRLVEIHPFPNGNGRQSRAMTDMLLRAISEPAFTWGSASLNSAGATRTEYIHALREADGRQFDRLAAFVRS
jgi:Fic-DOC domain mobile mystery protein B